MVHTLITTAAAVPPLATSAVEAALAPGAVEGFDSKAFDAALADTLALFDNAAGLVPSAFAKAPADGDMAVRFPLLTPVIPEWVADADITVPLPAKGSTTAGELELSEPADDAFD